MTDKPRRLPCPNSLCEDGTVLMDHTRRTDWEPHEVREKCETCDGDGEVGWWECGGGCDRSFDCGDEMPAYTFASGGYQCRDCLTREALDGVDFAAVAAGLRRANKIIDDIGDNALERAVLCGQAMGAIGFYADKLEKLARALEGKS